MTQIVVTLDNNADANLLRRMIENMRGVLDAKLSHTPSQSHKVENKTESWFDDLESLRKCYDSSYIDTDDERTQYILSK